MHKIYNVKSNFLIRLDDTKDMVVQALVAQITVDGIIGLDCFLISL
jgi:hypothetical protein